MRTLLLLGLTGIAAALLAAGCGGAERAASLPAQATAVETEPPTTTAGGSTAVETAEAAELPEAVAATRDAIVAASHARDYAALGMLLDPATFSYSFGEGGDPVGYWRMLEEEGEVPILGDFLPLVLTWPAARTGDTWVWPSAHARAPEQWTDDDVAPLRQLYTADEIDGFVQAGGYLGYRVGIREDGTWLYFVSGD